MGLIELSLWDKLRRLKADKVVGAVEGNFAKLDANGNLVDSGHKDADYEDADATILKEADVVDSLDSTSTKAPLSANQGKVLKDAVDPIEARLDTTELTLAQQGQDLASVKQTLQQGNGATLDFSDIGIVPLDARATGRANPLVDGLTATNLVVNGDFSQGTTGWTGYASTISQDTTKVTGKSVLKLTVGVNALCGIRRSPLDIDLVVGHKYIFAFSILPKYGNTTFVYTGVESTVAIVPIPNVWNTYFRIMEITQDNTDFHIIHRTSTNYSNGDEVWVSDVYTLDLTSIYGAGNEPSEADCAKIFSYFDGTKSIQLPARLRSVGKNLIGDKHIVNGEYASSSYGFIATNSTRSRTTYIPLISSQNYFFKLNDPQVTSETYAIFYDANFNYVRAIGGIMTQLSFTSGASEKYVIFSIIGDGNFSASLNQMMLNTGATALPYEPYTDSTLYLADNEEVRSVPAIADEVKVVNGQLVKVQNVQRYVLQESNFVSFRNDKTNFDYIQIPVNVIGYSASSAIRDGKTTISGFTETYSANLYINDDPAFVGRYDLYTSVANFTLGVEKGKYASLAEAQADLAGTVIYYQLATPIITPLLTSGILQAKPNGTVYFEPYYEGSHQTNASSQITLPYEGTIDKVTGYDENLEPYEVPSTAYTLVGTTLTITGAVENEVFYVELSRSEPLAPELIVNTLNNDQVTLDSADGKYYQIGFTTTNGVPTVTATEVV